MTSVEADPLMILIRKTATSSWTLGTKSDAEVVSGRDLVVVPGLLPASMTIYPS